MSPAPRMIDIAILLPGKCFGSGVAGSLDIFALANRLNGRALFRWRLLSEHGEAVSSETGLRFEVEGDFRRASRADVVLLHGIPFHGIKAFERELPGTQALSKTLRDAHAAGCVVAANCTGVVVLAESGLLDGRPATVCWWLSAWFRTRYPRVALQTHAVLAESERVLCSGATTSWLNLSLRLVEQFGGAALAQRCSRLMLIDQHRSSQAPWSTLQQYEGHGDLVVATAQEWLHAHVAEPFSLAALARVACVGERTLMRRFKQALGDTPLHYLQQLRLFAARDLLEAGRLSVEQIVVEVGYSDVSTFRKLFRRELHCTPNEYRKRFTRAQQLAA